MTTIPQSDLTESIRAALQYISFYHPVDYITNLARAWELEQSPAAKDAITQILVNSRMCAEGHRPICQDTGIVTIFLKIGLDVRLTDAEGSSPSMSLQQICDEGVRRAWLDPDNKLRGSILADPAFARKNTVDNTPCVVEVSLVPGNTIDVTVAAKGGGSEAKSKFVMLNPSDSILDWVLKTVPTMGAGWCPPGMLGIGIGGTAEKSHAPRQAGPHGRHRHAGAQGPRRFWSGPHQHRKTPHRNLRQGQRPRHRRAGPRRPHHRPRRQDPRLPHPRGQPPRCDDPQLRGDTPCASWYFAAKAPSTSTRPTSKRGRSSPTPRTTRTASTSTPSPTSRSASGSPARSSSSPASSSPAATPPTSA